MYTLFISIKYPYILTPQIHSLLWVIQQHCRRSFVGSEYSCIKLPSFSSPLLLGQYLCECWWTLYHRRDDDSCAANSCKSNFIRRVIIHIMTIVYLHTCEFVKKWYPLKDWCCHAFYGSKNTFWNNPVILVDSIFYNWYLYSQLYPTFIGVFIICNWFCLYKLHVLKFLLNIMTYTNEILMHSLSRCYWSMEIGIATKPARPCLHGFYSWNDFSSFASFMCISCTEVQH